MIAPFCWGGTDTVDDLVNKTDALLHTTNVFDKPPTQRPKIQLASKRRETTTIDLTTSPTLAVASPPSIQYDVASDAEDQYLLDDSITTTPEG